MTNCDETSCGVYTAGVITDGEGTVIERVETGASGDVYPDLLVRMPIPPHSSQLVRADYLREVGGFDTDLEVACDWDLTVRLAKRWKFTRVPDVLVERIHHDRRANPPRRERDQRPGVRRPRQTAMADKHREAIEAAGSDTRRAFEARVDANSVCSNSEREPDRQRSSTSSRHSASVRAAPIRGSRSLRRSVPAASVPRDGRVTRLPPRGPSESGDGGPRESIGEIWDRLTRRHTKRPTNSDAPTAS
jgi:hypothetical protein